MREFLIINPEQVLRLAMQLQSQLPAYVSFAFYMTRDHNPPYDTARKDHPNSQVRWIQTNFNGRSFLHKFRIETIASDWIERN
jgi:hypothetical protein